MPLYEYRCQKCSKTFEMLRRMQDADRGVECPECRSEEVERLMSTFSAGGCSLSGSGKFT
ncbi:MAG TPA: zinc ribbon domain-containing protein [Candidatus Acidoferrales bacterium]|nr:zinc ribbon domain-containing protein [Candidatus Acidoferrales bacterium]